MTGTNQTSPRGTPCFAERLNLVLGLLKSPPHPKTGESRGYTIAELADAIGINPIDGRRRVSESRLRQLAKDRNTSPSVEVAGWIAEGLAVLAHRSMPAGTNPKAVESIKHYLMIASADDDADASPAELATLFRLHEQFSQLRAERERKAEDTVSVLGRYLDLESETSRERVLTALDAALREEGKRGLRDRFFRRGD